MSTNGLAGMRPVASCAATSLRWSSESPRCTVPARRAGSADHGTGPSSAQSIFTVAWSYCEPAHALEHARREMLRAHERAVERGRAHVGEHRAPHADLVAVLGAHRHRAAAAHLDRRDGGRADDPTAARLEAAHQRVGEPTGAAFGDGEAVLLAERREHPAEEPAQRLLGPEVGVQRVAGEQQRAARARERLLRHGADREQREPGEARPLARPDGGGQAPAGDDRRERGEQRVDEMPADAAATARTARARPPPSPGA